PERHSRREGRGEQGDGEDVTPQHGGRRPDRVTIGGRRLRHWCHGPRPAAAVARRSPSRRRTLRTRPPSSIACEPLLLAVDPDAERRVDRPEEVEPILVADHAHLRAVARLGIILPRHALDHQDVPFADLGLQRVDSLAQRLEQRLLGLVLDVALGRGIQRAFVDLLVSFEELLGREREVGRALEADLRHRPGVEVRDHALHRRAVPPYDHVSSVVRLYRKDWTGAAGWQEWTQHSVRSGATPRASGSAALRGGRATRGMDQSEITYRNHSATTTPSLRAGSKTHSAAWRRRRRSKPASPVEGMMRVESATTRPSVATKTQTSTSLPRTRSGRSEGGRMRPRG